MDLDVLNTPDEYSILFYAADSFIKDGRLCRLADIANRVYVPPPKFDISISSTSADLRPGDDTTEVYYKC